MPRSSLLFFFLLILCRPLSAQQTDSLAILPKSIKASSAEHFFLQDSTFSPDSPLRNFHNFLPDYYLGNAGLPQVPVNTGFLQRDGLSFRPDHTAWYRFTPGSLIFYDTKHPYSDLLYVTGSRREQLFKMVFSVNVKPKWNITADFLRIRSEGFYKRQNTNNNCLALSSNYSSRNNRYQLLAGVFYNSIDFAQNGGISDSLFESAGAGQTLTEVNLSSASSTDLNRGLFLQQYFNIGLRRADTLAAPKPSSAFVLSSSYSDHFYNYTDEDPNSGFYRNIFYDSTRTYDSSFYYLLKNKFEWVRRDNGHHRGIADQLGFSAGISHNFRGFMQRSIDTAVQSLSATASLFNTYSLNGFIWRVNAEYGLTGYNEADLRAVADLQYLLPDSSSTLRLRASYVVAEPDLVFNRYESNHFTWSNDFDKQQALSASLELRMPRYDLKAELEAQQLSNILYFDNLAVPRQYSGSVPVFAVHLEKDFSVMNWHLDNRVTYQYVPDSTVIRLPSWNLQHSLYYENDVFHHAARLQVGLQFRMLSAYYAYAFMPATSQFYLQDEKKYGNYPYLDFFLNARVKMVRIFFKIEHFNAGLSGNGYMVAPEYPATPRSFKLGISWRFYD